jgi:hypothetical protein
MKHTTPIILLLISTSAGCAPKAGVGLGQPQPTTTATSSTSRAPASNTEPQPSGSSDLQAIIQGLGSPVPFEQVFAEVKAVPRFKGEFETAAQFEQRQAAARARCKERYLISTPVDPEEIRYDADKQVLIVTVWALKNTGSSDDELHALFGWSSELKDAKVEIKYGTSIWPNVEWAFPRDRRTVGTYDGQNAFGVRATIIKQEITATGIFEREGARGGDILDGEDVWFRRQPKDVEVSLRAAFEIKADPDRARALKQHGALRAAVLVAPRFPFYATGIARFTPTIRAPFDRTTNVRYLIGDIQAVALYDASGQMIAVRETR